MLVAPCMLHACLLPSYYLLLACLLLAADVNDFFFYNKYILFAVCLHPHRSFEVCHN